jgi:hypothetical protein
MSRVTAVMLSVAVLCVGPASFAATVQVGTCETNLVSFPTISLAVSGVPVGSTIEVCPGTYSEQVVITKPLTLKGISSQGDSAAVIAVPSAAMQPVPRSNNNDESIAQILVEDPGGTVNINNLIVDGTNASSQSTFLFVGIYYQDASGVINDVAVRNEAYPAGGGAGVVVENGVATQSTQSVIIENSVLAGMNGSGYGVWVIDGGNGISAAIRSNFIDGAGASNGLYLYGGPGTEPITGTISSNIISNFSSAGVSAINSTVTFTSNTIQNTVFLLADGSTLKSNHIDAGVGGYGYGVVLAGAGTNNVEANTIVNASTAAVFGCGPVGAILLPPASGDTITGNTILNANVGVEMPSGNTATPNTTNLTVSATQACP